MSKQTAATSTIQITATTPVLMLAMELGEEHWKLGFSSAFGQIPSVRDIGSRDTKALLARLAWAKKKLGLPAQVRVVSCYEAGREGFWLHRFLEAQGVESLIVDSSSIEVPQKRRRAKTDRLDLDGLCDVAKDRDQDQADKDLGNAGRFNKRKNTTNQKLGDQDHAAGASN